MQCLRQHPLTVTCLLLQAGCFCTRQTKVCKRASFRNGKNTRWQNNRTLARTVTSGGVNALASAASFGNILYSHMAVLSCQNYGRRACSLGKNVLGPTYNHTSPLSLRASLTLDLTNLSNSVNFPLSLSSHTRRNWLSEKS